MVFLILVGVGLFFLDYVVFWLDMFALGYMDNCSHAVWMVFWTFFWLVVDFMLCFIFYCAYLISLTVQLSSVAGYPVIDGWSTGSCSREQKPDYPCVCFAPVATPSDH